MGAGRLKWGRCWRGTLVSCTSLIAPSLAHATPFDTLALPAGFDASALVSLTIAAGFGAFAVAATIALKRERNRHRLQRQRLEAEITDLRHADNRIRLLLGMERQLIVSWGSTEEPRFEGDTSVAGADMSGTQVLTFGFWLALGEADALESAIAALRQSGTGFRMVLHRPDGGPVEALGATSAGQAVLRLRDIAGEQSKLLATQAEREALKADLDIVFGLLNALPQPVWLRNASDGLVWANRAFLEAVETPSLAEVREHSIELLDRTARTESARLRRMGQVYEARAPAVIAGRRRIIDVIEQPTPSGSAGIAVDVTDVETMRSDLRQQAEAHSRTLDQLPTAVAIFDKGQKLTFHNSAYKALWKLPSAFLDGRPGDGEILDRLRSERQLPEQADFRAWKAEVLSAYHGLEQREIWWHLPDRRALRVVVNPNPQGGVTYLFDDVTDRFRLETDFNAVVRVQGETLDTLGEGVAVFGSDGKLRLANRAFATMWGLPGELIATHPHIDAVSRQCQLVASDSAAWNELRAAVASLPESRVAISRRIARNDDTVFNCTAQPLPDGATLLTFSDITASENVARALTERNEALERAASLRDLFIHDVSYELRTPLTNILGFTEMLGSETMGPLNDKQREYSRDIERSSKDVLALLNDIHDLAGLDAGSLELVPERVDILETVTAVVASTEERIAENGLKLVVDMPQNIGHFTADGKRVRQMLLHMLSGAIGASAAGQTITIAARRTDDEIVLSVADEGRGAQAMIRTRAFERREEGGGHRGAGLQLTIVQHLVELHGGHIDLTAEPERGTIVSCGFPIRADDTAGQVKS